MPTRMDFDLEFGRPGGSGTQREGLAGPMRILILGDLTGRSAAPSRAPAAGSPTRKTLPVDIDNFEQVLGRMAPRLQPEGDAAGESGAAIEFRSLDDFHPDALYRRLAMFEPMRTMRKRLLNPATSTAAIAELTSTTAQQPAASSAGPEAQAADETDDRTLERLLGARPVNVAESAARLARQQVNLDRFIREIVAPHVVQGAPPEQTRLVKSIDDATGALMRSLLHDPAFQALESIWRSIHGLVVNLETGEDLEIHLLDLAACELEAELSAAAADPSASSLYRLLVEDGPGDTGERSWSLLAGNYQFGTEERDTRMLATLGAIAARAGAPFVAAADTRILGCESLVAFPDPGNWPPLDDTAAHRWESLRRSPNARWLGLALPRVLLRLPYGRETDEAEQFGFEETGGGAWKHDDYLWGNPAFACARLLGESFSAAGAAMQPGDHLDLDDLPAHTRAAGDGPVLQACAELLLTERAGEAIMRRGLMPLLSFRNRNMARLVRFQSVADPPAGLAGPWGS